jgi:hypothetical protein
MLKIEELRLPGQMIDNLLDLALEIGHLEQIFG